MLGKGNHKQNLLPRQEDLSPEVEEKENSFITE